jgi:hypothetical protein
MWRPWLQLNVKVKILDILPYHGCPFFVGINIPTASLFVLFGLELGKI